MEPSSSFLGSPPVHALADDDWQMAPGERAALEGVLAQVRPRVAIEIGTAQGGSLRRIAHYSEQVHSFDLAHEVDEAAFPNVTFHRGDSHELLPAALRELEAQGVEVDFALVDGDHRGVGARADLEDLLRSDAVRHATILLHDTMNEDVRGGLQKIDWSAYPKVRYVDLCFTQLDHTLSSAGIGERWGGLGLVHVHADGDSGCREGVVPRRHGIVAYLRELSWRTLAPARALRRGVRHRVKDLLRRRGRV